MYNPQLDTFVQVAESGSFSTAARTLYISPTAVIKQMNLLEARLERVSLEDLHGHTLMLVQRGWNADVDLLRDEVWRNYPQIEVRDFPQYKLDVFNECASEGAALAVFSYMADVHPMLATVPGDWDCAVTYGIMYAPRPSEHVARFIDAVRAITEESEK